MKTANDPSLELLREKIRVLLNNYADDIATGACKNFPEYTRLAGVIQGLAQAERELLDLDKDLLNSP